MALSTRAAIIASNAALDALARLLDNGYLRFYSSAQEATPETAVSGTLLAECRFSATSAPAASARVLTMNAITDDSSADNTGTVQSARALKSDGSSAVIDLTVGVGGTFNVNVPTTSVVAAATFGVTSMTVGHPMQGA